MITRDSRHRELVKKICKDLQIFFRQGKKVKIYHKTTNSTRVQSFKKGEVIDISNLQKIITIDKKGKCAIVESNVAMDTLISETLLHGLVPPVVMEFPGITVGGGIQGGAGESSSFKWGLFHKLALEYEVVLANGKVVEASPKKNADLFYAMPGSYGTLGIITLVKLKLIPAKPFVQITYHKVSNFKDAIATTKKLASTPIDFIDGILFSKNLGTVMTGKFCEKNDLKEVRFGRAWNEWFYLHAYSTSKKYKTKNEIIPLKDYLFRYNRGGFWVGKYFFTKTKIPFNRFMRFLYNPFMKTRTLYRFLHAINISQTQFVQDICLPEKSALPFLEYSHKHIGIYPIWLCAGWTGDKKEKLSPGFLKTNFVIDVGVWGKVRGNYKEFVKLNREIEHLAHKLGGRKVLYAHAYYTKGEFWKIYDKIWYNKLRKKYYAERTFPNIYEKITVKEKYSVSLFKGLISVIRSPFALPIS